MKSTTVSFSLDCLALDSANLTNVSSVNELDSCCKNFFSLVERMSASKYGWNSIGSTLINQSVLVAGWLLWGSQAGSAAFLSDMWCVIIGDICHTPPTTAPALHCCCSGTQWYPSNEGISSKRNVLTLLAHCWHSSACRQCPSCPLLLLRLEVRVNTWYSFSTMCWHCAAHYLQIFDLEIPPFDKCSKISWILYFMLHTLSFMISFQNDVTLNLFIIQRTFCKSFFFRNESP